jgi:hypothetical protein
MSFCLSEVHLNWPTCEVGEYQRLAPSRRACLHGLAECVGHRLGHPRRFQTPKIHRSQPGFRCQGGSHRLRLRVVAGEEYLCPRALSRSGSSLSNRITTVLNAFTTRACGAATWICSAKLGPSGRGEAKLPDGPGSRLFGSSTIFPASISGSAGITPRGVHNTTSPNAAASSCVAARAPAKPVAASVARTGSRDPKATS